jgi:DNA-binding CsgD family transcriptional regulator
VAPTVVAYLERAVGGNPLALLEAARALPEAQLAGVEALPSRLSLRVSAVDLYGERIRGLAPHVIATLLVLALDTTVNPGVLLAAATHLGVDYRSGVEALEAAGLITVDYARPAITHPLVRAAAEDVAAPSLVRMVHAALAQAVGTSAEPSVRAWHLAAAATEAHEEAAAALEAAALEAHSRSAYAAAALAFERSAGLSLDDRRRAHRLFGAARSARLAGRLDRAARFLDAAVRLPLDPWLAAQIAEERARAELHHGRVRSAQILLEEGASHAQDVKHAARLLGVASFCAMLAGDLASALELAHHGRDLGGIGEVAIVELSLGFALLHRGDIIDSVGVLVRAADLAHDPETGGDPEYLPFAAMALTWAGDVQRARVILAGLLPSARPSSSFGLLCSALYVAGYVEARTGHLITAYALANEALSVARTTQSELWEYLSLCCLAYVDAAQGRVEDCHSHAEEALQISRGLELSYPATAWDALGLLELSLRHPEQAVTYLEQANGAVADAGEATLARPTGFDLVEASLRAGHDLSPAMLRRITAISAFERSPIAAATAWRCRGLLAVLETEIETSFRAALRLHEQIDHPFALARTELCYGEALRRVGRRRNARGHLRRALLLFEDLGATEWARWAEEELVATGGPGPVQIGQPVKVDSLTPQELHVALTVAGGATNREAATALYLSPKTIEFHLHQVYRKLGIRSRTELAVRIAALPGVSERFAHVLPVNPSNPAT